MKENYNDYTEPSNSKTHITTILAVSLFLFVGVFIMFKVAPILELFKSSKYDWDENVENIDNNRKKSVRKINQNSKIRSWQPYVYVPHLGINQTMHPYTTPKRNDSQPFVPPYTNSPTAMQPFVPPYTNSPTAMQPYVQTNINPGEQISSRNHFNEPDPPLSEFVRKQHLRKYELEKKELLRKYELEKKVLRKHDTDDESSDDAYGQTDRGKRYISSSPASTPDDSENDHNDYYQSDLDDWN